MMLWHVAFGAAFVAFAALTSTRNKKIAAITFLAMLALESIIFY